MSAQGHKKRAAKSGALGGELAAALAEVQDWTMKTSLLRVCGLALGLGAAVFLGGCQTNAYYSVLEKMGMPKRELLVKRVSETREAQEEAKMQFRSALEQFLAVAKVDGGELQVKYEKLADELKSSETKAKAVRDRIAALDSVATALFAEWKTELGQYTSQALRSQSEAQFKDTEARYQKLTAAMQKASSRMDPVLATFRDQVLFLKHNLNARAVSGLAGTSKELERDIGRLVAEMERSISEADAFIRAMQTPG